MSSKKNLGALVTGLQSNSGMSRLQQLARGATAEPATRAEPVQRKEAVAGYQVYSPIAEYQPGDHVLLPLDLLAEDERNPRVFYPEADMQKLKASLAQYGQLQAIQVYPKDASGKFHIKSGHRRSRVMRHASWGGTIKAEIVSHSGDILRDYRDAREINIGHKSHTHLDDAVRFKEFLDKGEVKDQQTLAASVGMADSEVSKLLSIATMPRPALELMAESPSNCGLVASYLLFRYWSVTNNDQEALMRLIRRVVDGKVTTRQLEQLVKEQKATDGDKRRMHAFSRAAISGFAKGELKAFEGKLTLTLEKMPNDKRDALFHRIVKVFEEQGLEVGGMAAVNDGS